MEATATTTKKVISDKSVQAQKLMSRATNKVVDVKKAQANDIDKEEVNEEIVKQNKHNDEKAIELAKALVEKTKKSYDDAKKALAILTGKPAKSNEPKGPGVISTIFDLVKSSKKGITKAELLTKLVELFPDREKAGMEKTINVQLPKRMSTERKVNIIKSEDGKFSIK
jgi:hypothetical protein